MTNVAKVICLISERLEVKTMENLCWECSVCDACGVCGRTEDNCVAYHEFFQIKDVDLSTADLYSEYTLVPAVESTRKTVFKHAAGL